MCKSNVIQWRAMLTKKAFLRIKFKLFKTQLEIKRINPIVNYLHYSKSNILKLQYLRDKQLSTCI